MYENNSGTLFLNDVGTEKMDIFDDHIDKVNNVCSKKYLPDDTKILSWVWVDRD